MNINVFNIERALINWEKSKIEGIMQSIENLPDDMPVCIGGKYDQNDSLYLDGTFGSDRGDYSNMYLGYFIKHQSDYTKSTVKLLKDTLTKALKQGEMIGYKGGEFAIDEETIVTIGERGMSGHIICNVVVIDDVCYIVTIQ